MIEMTRNWVETMVIGLGLCPFAEKVFNNETIRYGVSLAENPEDLLMDLEKELQYLVSSPRTKVETTLLILPNAYKDFLDFNDFTGEADKLLGTLGLIGTVQIAGFHPHYLFEGTNEESPENYTNRSPFPMLHLLREISISEIAETRAELLKIPERNIKLLYEMGLEKILEKIEKSNAF